MIETGKKLFLINGYANTSVEEIAERSRLTIGALYYHFKGGKNELFLAIVDDQGNIAEDLRGQILGQLSERLNYDRLYQEALSDPELRRTQVELEAALANSREAREVVFDLFQDLDGFSLD